MCCRCDFFVLLENLMKPAVAPSARINCQRRRDAHKKQDVPWSSWNRDLSARCTSIIPMASAGTLLPYVAGPGELSSRPQQRHIPYQTRIDNRLCAALSTHCSASLNNVLIIDCDDAFRSAKSCRTRVSSRLKDMHDLARLQRDLAVRSFSQVKMEKMYRFCTFDLRSSSALL